MEPIEIHKKIDQLIQGGINFADVHVVREIIFTNEDSRRYFFSQANELWLKWLWDNRLLDEIKKPSTDVTKYAYRLPELDYLSRMAEKDPKQVVDIMLAVKSTPEAFNPEVVDRFLWTATFLPADELKRLAPKMLEENWVKLMGRFNRWGFEYEKILEKLSGVKDYESILSIATSVFTLRAKEDLKEGAFGVTTDNPFLFNDISNTKVFEYLAGVDEGYLGDALKLGVETLSSVVLLGNESEGTFTIHEPYALYDVDFFTIELGSKRHLSHRDDVRELAAVVKTLTQKILNGKCADKTFVRHIYDSYFAELPNSWGMYRLRLYVYSLCPDVFKTEINEVLHAIFEVGKGDLTSGAEFERLLMVVFPSMSNDEQRAYVKKVIDWHKAQNFKDTPRGILSAVFQWLTPEEKKAAEEAFGALIERYTPNAVVGEMRFGTATHHAPGDDQDWAISVKEIVEKLQTEWSPGVLHEKYKQDDMFHRRGAEGVGERLKNEVKKNIAVYTKNATLFFGKEKLDAHYTYSFFRGLEEYVRENPQSADVDWAQVIALSTNIANVITRDDQKVRERDQFDAWLAGWSTVNTSIADVLQQLLSGEGEKHGFAFLEHRKVLLDILTYLLDSLDPEPKENEEGDSEPYGRAINSTRGRSFQAFVFFIYHDGKQFKKEDEIQIAPDVMALYKSVLAKENTEAIYCLYGHYLASFYFRNEAEIKKLLPAIFPEDGAKKHLYLAAWEGYLTANIYKEIFDDPVFKGLYARAIKVSSDSYPKRRYSRDLDEGLAGHLALAYMHLGLDTDDDLFKEFWATKNTKRQKEFIALIGRSAISRSNPNAWLKQNPEVDLTKLIGFWNWALEHCDDAEALEGFGFWVSADEVVIPTKDVAVLMSKTLQKTGGGLDWEYGLIHQILTLAKESPVETLDIVRSSLMATNLERAGAYIYIDREIPDVIRALYSNPDTKEGTRKLVNDLLALPVSQRFWGLIKIVGG